MKHRLFIAVEIPDHLRRDISRLQNKLEQLNLPIRWEDPEKLHLTLNFLGRIDDSDMPLVSNLILDVAQSVNPFVLTPAFLETMYKRHEPSYIYLGISGDLSILKNLHTDLTSGLNQLGIPQTERFFAHITIGRMKRTDPTTTKSLLVKIGDFKYSSLKSFKVENLTLFESFISQKGSHYRVIGRYMLK